MQNDTSSRPVRLRFEPAGIQTNALSGTSVTEAALAAGIALRSDCGGKGTCGKCRVQVTPAGAVSPPEETEMRLLSPADIQSGFRLACRAILTEGPVTVVIPETGGEAAFGKTETAGKYAADPAVARVVLESGLSVEAANRPRDAAALIRDRLKAADPTMTGELTAAAVFDLGRGFGRRGPATAVVHETLGVTGLIPGSRTRSLGIAFDIGTTTLAAYLCDFSGGAVIAAQAAVNPQRRYGEDVISRIAYAADSEAGFHRLVTDVRSGVNGLIHRCLTAAGAGAGDIDEAAVVGNTAMLHFFFGIPLQSLGRAPYLPITAEPILRTARETGLDIHPGAGVFGFPVVSGFVGGDTAGVLLSQRPHESEAMTLIIDIGTNGEIVLGNRRRLWATSCATGPALEGALIEDGMRAGPGAVDQVTIDPESLQVHTRTIAGEKPRGICGSGVIDAVAAMGRAGLLRPTGRMKEGMPGVLVDEKGIGRRFVLVPPDQTAHGRAVSITLNDIRQIQLAKGAMITGVRHLMEAAGCDRIDRVVLTGAFGARFDWQNAVFIGMVPDPGPAAEVAIVQNAAGEGAIAALLDKTARAAVKPLVDQIHHVNLAESPDFALAFAEAMTFPFS